MSPNLEDDARIFVDEARKADFSSMSKRDAQRWVFGVKKEMSARYETSIDGFEDDYELTLALVVSDSDNDTKDSHAEFVVDRRGDEVEVDDTKVNEVWTE
ncbi:MAG: hypothetical protein SXQ77_09445 [Halobacteria archaeon]|nr:hypothetical protein [Halobacteria archaeon]